MSEQPAHACMRVKDWMTPNPITVRPNSSVLNARRLLAGYGVRHLPVVGEGDRLVGIVSVNDLQVPDHQIVAGVSTLGWDLLIGRYRAVETVMRSPVATVTPDEPLTAAAQTMLAKHVGALPVVQGGQVVGILSATDSLRALLDYEARQAAPAAEVAVDPDDYKPTPFEAFA